MSRFLLDTNVLTLAQFGHRAVLGHLASHPVTEIALPIIALQEQMNGWLGRIPRLKTPKQQADWYNRFVNHMLPVWREFEVLSFTEPAILRFDHLRSLRLNVGLMDLRIAAIALECSCIVVTSNTRDFGRVPGLTTVDWTV
jgi:tRNA(fMet)-specific endonuclease VapC